MKPHQLKFVLQFLAVIGLSVNNTFAFCPSVCLSSADGTYNRGYRWNTRPDITTALRSIIIEPPADDDCHIDAANCEESIFDRKRREKAEAKNLLQQKYRNEYGIELNDVDFMDSPDQYRNSQLGGSLVSGVNLSALCEDD
jgi:hypothetical protein